MNMLQDILSECVFESRNRSYILRNYSDLEFCAVLYNIKNSHEFSIQLSEKKISYVTYFKTITAHLVIRVCIQSHAKATFIVRSYSEE